MQTVGELDQHGAYVILEGEEHLAEIVNLLCGLVFVLFLLCHHLHEKGHIGPEHVADILDGVVGILDYVMKEGRHHGVGVKHELVGHDCRDGYRMKDVWLTGLSLLVAVGFAGEAEGLFDSVELTGGCACRHDVEHFLRTFLDYGCIIFLFRIDG